MASYRVVLTASAEKELSKLSSRLIERIVPRLESRASNPRPNGCKKLKGGEREWRIRVGDYRVICNTQDKVVRVLVLEIGNRREVYR